MYKRQCHTNAIILSSARDSAGRDFMFLTSFKKPGDRPGFSELFTESNEPAIENVNYSKRFYPVQTKVMAIDYCLKQVRDLQNSG